MSLTAHQSAVAGELGEIGKYHVIAELARGGMGNVYLAALCGPGRFHKLLVLKELKPELADDETFVTMFLEEARLAARLVHPNIVQLNEVSSTADRYYMAMEYLDGRSLSRVVRRFAREGGFPVAAQLRVIGDALLGLHYAHELRGFTSEPFGIVHRDVSPLNVMVTFDGQVKLLDFGIAKTHDSSLETRAGVLKGRVAYMAPEQAFGREVDRRADIYAAGVMIWEAVAGRRLWPNMSEVEILSRVLGDERPRLRDVVPGVPAKLDTICSRAMAIDRNDRYPTAAALLEDLEDHLAERTDGMTTRQIGEAVAVVFADERYKMNQIIEERLAHVAAGAGLHSGVIETQVATTPSKGWPVPRESASSSGAMVIAQDKDYAPAMWSERPPKNAGGETLSAGGPRLRPSPAHAGLQAGGVDEAPPTSWRLWTRRRAVAAGGLALLLVGSAAWRLGSTTQRQSPTVSSAPPIGLPATAPAAAVSPAPPPSSTGTETPAPAEAPRVAPKTAPRETAPAPPKGRLIAKPPAASATPQAAPSQTTPTDQDHRPAPANCDPPYTVDSNGIEHFKTGCL
jgi:tRNA A-37 threonylcarbamoyl transferase component Bud32